MRISIETVNKIRVFWFVLEVGEQFTNPLYCSFNRPLHFETSVGSKANIFFRFFFIELCALNKYSPGIRIDNIVSIRSFPSSVSTYVGVMIGSDS